MSLVQSAEAVNGKLVGTNVDFTRVTTDTRQAAPGDLFIALVGPNFDGHDFIEQAKASGVAAAMLSRIQAWTSGMCPAKPATTPQSRMAASASLKRSNLPWTYQKSVTPPWM